MSVSDNFPDIRPTLLLDFANVGMLDPRITFTRASTATYFDQLGVLQTAQNNVARFDYNPSTLAARGLLIEEQRTNSIRNNTMQGAVAGTPGTVPTNWSTFTSLTGLTREVVGTGTEKGITYIDIKLSGTPSGAGDYQIYTESLTQVVASSGQSWDSSFYYKLQAGSLTGVTDLQASVVERTAAGVFLAGTYTSVTAPSATLVRGDTARTLTNASTARVSGDIRIALSGVAIDITLRIGLPQLELGAFATSVIPTTTTALTRNADVASMTGTNFSSWYNQSEGAFVGYATTLKASPASSPILIAQVSGGNDRHQIGVYTQTVATVVGGAVQVAMGTNTNATVRTAYAYKLNDYAASTNGGTVSTDTSATVPTVNYLSIGKFDFGGAESLSGWVQRIAYYSTRLPNDQLQALTL